MSLGIEFNGYNIDLQGWHLDYDGGSDKPPVATIHYKDGLHHNETGPAVVAFKTIRSADPGDLRGRRVPDLSRVEFYLQGQRLKQDVWEQRTGQKWSSQSPGFACALNRTLPAFI